MSYNSDATWNKQPWEAEFSPAAATLTYAAAMATDGIATIAGNYPRKQQFNLTATGNAVINAPTLGRDGQVLQFLVTASGGARTVSFGAGIVSPGLVNGGVIASGKTRCIEIEYNGTEWFCTLDREESYGPAAGVSTETYASSVTVDAGALAMTAVVNITLTGDITLPAPTNPKAGQVIHYSLTASGGARTISAMTSVVGPAIASVSAGAGVIASGKTRVVSIVYNGTAWFRFNEAEQA